MPPSLPALGLQGGVTQDQAQLRDPRAWATTSPQGNSDCTKRPKAGGGGGERTAAPSPAPAQVGRQRTRPEGGNSERRGSQPRDPWAAAVRRRQGPILGSRGTGDRDTGSLTFSCARVSFFCTLLAIFPAVTPLLPISAIAAPASPGGGGPILLWEAMRAALPAPSPGCESGPGSCPRSSLVSGAD